jgi:cell division protein FtsN
MRAACLSAALAAAAIMLAAGDSLAQAGAGAESYEVTISPPKRPGSEPAPDASAAAAAPGTEAAAVAPASEGAAGSPDAAALPSSSAPAAGVPAAPASVAKSAPVAAKPTGPPRTLQVAAFRQHDRAETLREELAGEFPDVAILEVSSGGEPLYRVNVGRLPKGAQLDELKKRLAAAGFPSFDVAAPAPPASD